MDKYNIRLPKGRWNVHSSWSCGDSVLVVWLLCTARTKVLELWCIGLISFLFPSSQVVHLLTVSVLALTLVVYVLHVFSSLCLAYAVCNYPSCPCYPTADHALLTKLQQANLITSEEREGLTDPSDVAKVQSSKSAEVMDDTAHIMRKFKHQRFQRASSFLSGTQSTSFIHLCCAAQ